MDAAVRRVMESHAQALTSEAQAAAALERVDVGDVDPGPLLQSYPQDFRSITVKVEKSYDYTSTREFLVTVTPPGSRGCFTVPATGAPTVTPC
jgi:hypothetical protein